MLRRLALPMFVALGITLAACGGGSGPGGGGGAALDGREILDFTLPAVDGPDIAGRDYSGKALALWFWAPW